MIISTRNVFPSDGFTVGRQSLSQQESSPVRICKQLGDSNYGISLQEMKPIFHGTLQRRAGFVIDGSQSLEQSARQSSRERETSAKLCLSPNSKSAAV